MLLERGRTEAGDFLLSSCNLVLAIGFKHFCIRTGRLMSSKRWNVRRVVQKFRHLEIEPRLGQYSFVRSFEVVHDVRFSAVNNNPDYCLLTSLNSPVHLATLLWKVSRFCNQVTVFVVSSKPCIFHGGTKCISKWDRTSNPVFYIPTQFPAEGLLYFQTSIG